jgi:hypothetical protein
MLCKHLTYLRIIVLVIDEYEMQNNHDLQSNHESLSSLNESQEQDQQVKMTQYPDQIISDQRDRDDVAEEL